MCNFISFKIEKSPEGLKIITAPDLESHSEIPGDGYEGEWLDNGELEVRVAPDVSDCVKSELEAYIRKTYKTRQKMIDKLIIYYLATGVLPDRFYEHSKLDDRKLRLFACDCAERALPFFEKSYPNDKRPRISIEMARKFANGEVTNEEMTAAWAAAEVAAEVAAWDAARDAARAAAWDAAIEWQAEKLLEYINDELRAELEI